MTKITHIGNWEMGFICNGNLDWTGREMGTLETATCERCIKSVINNTKRARLFKS